MTEYLFAKKYGAAAYDTEKSVVLPSESRFPELNTGFLPAPDFQRELTVSQDEEGCYVDSEKIMEGMKEAGEFSIPLFFRADMKEQGTFRLTISLHARKDEREVLLFAGRRQLLWRGSLKAGEEWTGSFPVAICDFIPRGEILRHKKTGIEVTVISKEVRLVRLEIEKWNGKTLWLAGDSTVTDQTAFYPYAPQLSYGGWGQMLPCFLEGTMAVSNHAHSGLTTESFKEEGHYDILLDYIQPGDWCFFQFGHNDQKLEHLKAEGGYRDRLKQYIQDMRQKGVIPVLVTPLARNSWDDLGGSYMDRLDAYAVHVIQLGRAMSVPVLDLHEKSMSFIKQYGLEDSKRWFYPWDYTHTNDFGAWKMAEFIWGELENTGMVEKKKKPIFEWDPPKVW